MDLNVVDTVTVVGPVKMKPLASYSHQFYDKGYRPVVKFSKKTYYAGSRAEDIQVGTECANVAKWQRRKFF